MKIHETFRDEFIRRNHDLGSQCDRALGWILLAWGLCVLASGCLSGAMFLGWLPPVLLWGIFRIVKTWKQCCPNCHSRWLLERIPAVIASGRCPSCHAVLWEVKDISSSATLPQKAKLQRLLWFLLVSAALLLGIFWINFDYVFNGLFQLAMLFPDNYQTLIIFCAPGLVLLFCWLIYRLALWLAKNPSCPLCHEPWSRSDQKLFRTFGTCSHCGERVVPPADYASDRPGFALIEECKSNNWAIMTPDGICMSKPKYLNLLQIGRHITFYGIVIIAVYACYVITLENIGHICASMVPAEGPEPYRRDFWFVCIAFLLPVGMLFFWEWSKYYFFSCCSHCHKYLDRDIVALTGHCCHCGEKYEPPAKCSGLPSANFQNKGR